MCTVSNRKITLVVFKLKLNDVMVGEAICSYDYNTCRDDIDTLLSIEMYISMNPPLVKELYIKNIEEKIINFDNSSQALDIIKAEIYPMFVGITIETFKTSFEFEFAKKQDKKIKLTKIESPNLEYEITNIETGKFYTLKWNSEEEVIDFAYNNL